MILAVLKNKQASTAKHMTRDRNSGSKLTLKKSLVSMMAVVVLVLTGLVAASAPASASGGDNGGRGSGGDRDLRFNQLRDNRAFVRNFADVGDFRNRAFVDRNQFFFNRIDQDPFFFNRVNRAQFLRDPFFFNRAPFFAQPFFAQPFEFDEFDDFD